MINEAYEGRTCTQEFLLQEMTQRIREREVASGWYSFARLRYAALISAWDAVWSTPRISYSVFFDDSAFTESGQTVAADAVTPTARVGGLTPGLKWLEEEWQREVLGGKKVLPSIVLYSLKQKGEA
ncbi:unnamed protein product [Dovyalis caffra]|uniref:Uncharacterized protein n=1 Tax=Dovyalis caffra TaxID=77055 RepID=A0AAV1QST3_9ROSI|nr:unnamed protein product [Dovyalis caffra]